MATNCLVVRIRVPWYARPLVYACIGLRWLGAPHPTPRRLANFIASRTRFDINFGRP